MDHLKKLQARPEIDITLRYDSQTPLNAACSHKQIEVARLLLRHGADPNVSAGNPALVTAINYFGTSDHQQVASNDDAGH